MSAIPLLAEPTLNVKVQFTTAQEKNFNVSAVNGEIVIDYDGQTFTFEEELRDKVVQSLNLLP